MGILYAYNLSSKRSNYQTLLNNNIDGIAWDWVNKKLYWTDASERDIEVYEPSTGRRKLLVHTGVGSIPRAIVVDPATK